jgi:(E)-4-hydroxy-3-methylbut-2-enyl-diphosphate synthase
MTWNLVSGEFRRVNVKRTTVPVRVGGTIIGGGAPVAVQAMTDTDTADAAATARQCRALADAGAELVRIAVDTHESAAAVPEIKRRLADTGCPVPLVGDFHFNGHVILARNPACAEALDKYRVNPGNVGVGERHDANFTAICELARDNGKAIRIGVNGGSLDRELVTTLMAENADRHRGMTSQEVLDQCAVISALESTKSALRVGLGENRIVLSCKVSSPVQLIRIYRRLHRETLQPLHLGLTEAGMGARGLVWSAAGMGTLLAEGIGDTIRVSLTPPPGGDRRDEVYAARELLQSLAIRTFAPSVTSCPGCGRTTTAGFRELAQRVETHIRDRMPAWAETCPGVEALKVAVMGCIVNGPGESMSADIGISLPGTGEAPRCPVYIDGEKSTTLEGTHAAVTESFLNLIDDYVARRYSTIPR